MTTYEDVLEEAGPEQLEMDERPFSSSSEELETKFRKISQRLADFIALQEVANGKLAEEENKRRREMAMMHQELNDQVNEIRGVINEFQTVMTSVGIARFRVAAEEAMRRGDEHLDLIREECEQFKRITEERTRLIQQITQDAEKRLSRVVRSLRLEYFKKLIDDGVEHIEQTSKTAVKRITQTVKWVHWEKIGMSLIVAILVAILMGLFVNDEWPWETHQRVVTERDAGRMLLNAWPRLSKIEQSDIRKTGHVA